MRFYILLSSFIFKCVSICWAQLDFNRPITFSCVSHDNQTEFENFVYNASMNYYDDNNHDRLDILKNGRNLTVYFLGYEDKLSIKGHMFENSLGWHFETDTNVCLVQYKYLKDIKQAAFKLKNTVDNRLQIVAQQASEFIRKLMKENIVQSLENVVMVGYCFGAYIAAYTGRHLKSATNQLVKALFGLDPAGVSIFMSKDDHITIGDAKYVQIIHTSRIYGSMDRSSADNNIIVNGGYNQAGCKLNPYCSHFRSVEIFMLTISRRYRLVATKRGPGTYTKLDDTDHELTVPLKDDECLVGFYSSGLSKKGKFKIELPKTLFTY